MLGLFAARRYIQKYFTSPPSVGLILGSGLDMDISVRKEIPYRKIPHFPVSTVEGHQGLLLLGTACSREIMVMKGRVHLYEGFAVEEVVFSVAVMAAVGITRIIVTNASGGINTRYSPGDVMLITDHINLTGQTPLRGPRFVDMSRAYDTSQARAIRAAGQRAGLKVYPGVLAGVTGPMYETPAEVRMLRTLGADAVCMSTIHEVIAARSHAMEVLGLSFISNMATGMQERGHSHREVLMTAQKWRRKFSIFLHDVIKLFTPLERSSAACRVDTTGFTM